MAVEKMYMMNVVGKLPHVNGVVSNILKSESVELVNVINEIDANRFIFNLQDDSDLEKTIDLNYIENFPSEENIEDRRIVEEIKDYFNIDSITGEDFLPSNEKFDLKVIYSQIRENMEEYQNVEKELKELEELEQNLSLFQNVDVDLKDLSSLEYFEARYGILTRENRLKLKQNYGNILALVFHTGSRGDEEVYLALYPKETKVEVDRILKSLNWKDVYIPQNLSGTPSEIVDSLDKEVTRLENLKSDLELEKDRYLSENEDEIKGIIASESSKVSINRAKRYLARSENYFYLSGWVTASAKPVIEEMIKSYEDSVVFYDDAADFGDNHLPPTKLKNNAFFRPFELLVNMYGVPNYNELDPTTFVGLTYMIFFGAMFGDVGQGLVFVIAGLLISKYKNQMAGGLMTRVGISSTIFGFLYGSIFGNEHVIDALWIRPFEDINGVLIISIAFGLVLLSVAYILHFINAMKQRDLEEGLFGNEGLIAFLMFLTIVGFALQMIFGQSIVPSQVLVAIIILCILALMFRKVIMGVITKENPKYEGGSASSYYIENGFSIIETLISMASSIVSFIRLGAFAINHVGLFMAFQTIGTMTGSGIGNIIVLIIGNIVIIGLEGLIVFIQGLRLEYYELFNRYYKGSGHAFEAASFEK